MAWQHKEKFFERLHDSIPSSFFSDVEKTFLDRPPTFRVNTLRSRREDVLELLREHGFILRQVPWYQDAFILTKKTKRDLMKLDLYTSGAVYLQSLASMAPPLVLDPKREERVLDLAAAPGSKTSQIAALMKREGILIANDRNKVRFFKLKHNMELLGVTADYPDWQFTLRMEDGVKLSREFPLFFDRILLDAPCTAEARFVLSEPKTFGYWSERKIKDMVYAQWRLLLAAWAMLKPGGILVYSTCTFAPEENEVQVSRFIERNKDAEILESGISGLKGLPVVKTWKGKSLHSHISRCFRIFPTEEIEGFFVAKIQKSEYMT